MCGIWSTSAFITHNVPLDNGWTHRLRRELHQGKFSKSKDFALFFKTFLTKFWLTKIDDSFVGLDIIYISKLRLDYFNEQTIKNYTNLAINLLFMIKKHKVNVLYQPLMKVNCNQYLTQKVFLYKEALI